MTTLNITKWTFNNKFILANLYRDYLFLHGMGSVFLQVRKHSLLFTSNDVQVLLSKSKILSFLFNGIPNFHKVLYIHVFSSLNMNFLISSCKPNLCMDNLCSTWVFMFLIWYLKWCYCRNQRSRLIKVIKFWQ